MKCGRSPVGIHYGVNQVFNTIFLRCLPHFGEFITQMKFPPNPEMPFKRPESAFSFLAQRFQYPRQIHS